MEKFNQEPAIRTEESLGKRTGDRFLIDQSSIEDEHSLKLLATNEMQVSLAFMFYPDMPEIDAIEEFSKSGDFIRFRKIIEDEPEILTNYRKNPEETLENIKKRLVH